MSAEKGLDLPSALVPDRRKTPRYRYVASLCIRTAGGSEQEAMSIEISDAGMSVATDETLEIGEKVELDPIVGEKVLAVIRHKQGRIYGFEFVDLQAEHQERIRKMCRPLPRFAPKHLNI
ncbi:MAG TPA: PilZ domain-containing protein [Terriglobales bacterium]|nr:PilZ domain-containing protein [Terriglobales bacterium]